MKKNKLFIVSLIVFAFTLNLFIALDASSQEKKVATYQGNSDRKDNNTVALLRKISENGQETIDLLTEIRDLLKQQNEKLKK